jgi:hypothetical protein
MILTKEQLEQSQDWAEMNTTPYPLGWYLETIQVLQRQAGKTYEQVDCETRDELQACRERLAEVQADKK